MPRQVRCVDLHKLAEECQIAVGQLRQFGASCGASRVKACCYVGRCKFAATDQTVMGLLHDGAVEVDDGNAEDALDVGIRRGEVGELHEYDCMHIRKAVQNSGKFGPQIAVWRGRETHNQF